MPCNLHVEHHHNEENLAPQDQSNPFLLVYQIHTSDANPIVKKELVIAKKVLCQEGQGHQVY